MDWNEVLIQVINIVLPLFLALLSYGVTVGINYLRTKSANETMDKYITMLDVAARDAVDEVGQTFSDSIKASAEDGKLTNDEAAKALELAVMRTHDLLPQYAEAFLNEAYDDLDDVITAKIEAYVRWR